MIFAIRAVRGGGGGGGAGLGGSFMGLAGQLLIQAGYYIIFILFNGFFLMKFGATPGKMALGLKVVSPDGSTIGGGKAFGRTFAEILSGLICNIGYIIAAFDGQKRALHDHIAGTRVIRTR